MSRSIRLSCFLSALATGLAAAEPPVLRVPRLAKPPVIDGRFEPGEWDAAAVTGGFASQDLDWTLAPPWLQTAIRLGWDEGGLYLGLRARQDGTPTLARTLYDGDDAIVRDDCLEWLLLPSADRGQAMRPGGGFFRVLVNPRGARLDQRWEGPRPEPRPGWSSQAVVRCGEQEGDWVLELHLPAAALGRAPAAGSSWIMQAVRLVGGARLHTGLVPGNWLEWQRFTEVVFTAGEPAAQLLEVGMEAGALTAVVGLAAPAGRAAEAEVRLERPDGTTSRQRISAPAGGRTLSRLRLDALAGDGRLPPVGLAVMEGSNVLGRWNWRCLPADDAEALDLRERWLHQRQTCGLIGSLGELARIGDPLRQRIDQALAAGDLVAAERGARELAAALPWAPVGHRLLAGVLARAGRSDEALDALAAAAGRGDDDEAGLDLDPELQPLLHHPNLPGLRERLRRSPGWLPRPTAEPAPLRPRSLVEEGLLDWDAGAQQVVAHWIPQSGRSPFPVIAADDPLAPTLAAWWEAGLAAGNAGDLYDNRDGYHSLLRDGLFPQVARTVYRLPLRLAGLSESLPADLRHQGAIAVVGNVSQAEVVGPYRRCLARRELLEPRGLARLRWQYTHNQIYICPACFDHALPSERGGLGDVMPALTPYGLVSVGWSGTDQPLVRALFATLAAFRPEVKQRLLAEGRIAPVLQMILRRSLAGVDEDAAYLTARAHPAAFAGGEVRVAEMIALAQALEVDALPPSLGLRVLEEDEPAVAGRDFFEAPGREERLFDTPQAIARVVRSVRRQSWRLVVGTEVAGAAGTRVRWAVLRGQASVVPSPDGASAEIIVPWQERHPTLERSALLTDRVDVVCAAFDGRHWSAPAFISFYLPPDETRIYRLDGAVASVAYAGPEVESPYADPLLSLPKGWRDAYEYGPDGRLLGWVRSRGDVRDRFDTEGRLLGPDGPRPVSYRSERRGQRVPVVVYAPR